VNDKETNGQDDNASDRQQTNDVPSSLPPEKTALSNKDLKKDMICLMMST